MNQDHFKFPILEYVVQLLFSPHTRIINPRQFEYLYRLERLEMCWIRSHRVEDDSPNSSIERLEHEYSKPDYLGNNVSAQESSYTIDRTYNVIEFLERCWLRTY